MSVESKEKKTEQINAIQEALSRCNIGILTNYRGLTNSEITALRRKLQETDTEYKVVKNTMARFAAEKAGKEILADSFNGPIAIAFGYGDITAPAKILADYVRNQDLNLSITAAFLEDRLLTSDDILTLSTLPSREVLLARVFGQMMSPVSSLLGCLTAPMRGFIGILQARMTQLEGEPDDE